MPDAWLEPLSIDECRALLRAESVGRIAVVVNEFPIVLPINYRLVETAALTWIAVRTRPGNVLDQSPAHAAFEIDGIDSAHHEGWSVLARGTLHHVDPSAADFNERFGPETWLTAERDAWMVIQPFEITGRRLRAGGQEWAFHPNAYL